MLMGKEKGCCKEGVYHLEFGKIHGKESIPRSTVSFISQHHAVMHDPPGDVLS
jgi:hypothetical protein